MAIWMKWGETSQIACLTALRGTWGVRHRRNTYVEYCICYYRANMAGSGIMNDLIGVAGSLGLNIVQI